MREAKFEPLGPIHKGRKRIQPPREDLKDFYARANPLLKHKAVWFGSPERNALGAAIGAVANRFGYVVWACAVLTNHLHVVMLAHRDDATTAWDAIAGATREATLTFPGVEADHPVWSDRREKIFLYSDADAWRSVWYVEANPSEANLPLQQWTFVQRYDGWPMRRRQGG